MPGFVLVELEGYFGSIPTPEKRFNGRTSGVCVDGDEKYIGKKLFWEEFQASEVIEKDGKKYSFIALKDVRGYETNETTD